MAEFVKTGDREQIPCPIIKDPASKRKEQGSDLYTLAEQESPKSDLTDMAGGAA